MINTRVSIVLLTVGPRRSGCCLFAPFAPPHLTNDSGAPVTSDTDGNLLSAPVNGTLLGAVTWDARNRLLTAGNVTYTYDAENRRINSTKSAQTTTYTWSRGGLDRLLVKTNPDGSITRYIHGLGLIYEENTPTGGGAATATYYHFNWQGSTVALSNSTGTIIARMSYSPYGELTRESGTVTTPFLFNGQFGVMTEPNGLYCMMARFYSPIFRRFLSEDPAGFTGGINLFAYVSGDPVNLIDPFGLGPWPNQWDTDGDGLISEREKMFGIEGGNPAMHDMSMEFLDLAMLGKTAVDLARLLRESLTRAVAKEVVAETGQIALREGDVYLAVIMDGKIIAKTGDVLLSHEVFVARTVGVLPKGAEVVSIGKSEGVIAAITSKTFSGTQTYASEAAQAAADTAFK